MKTPKPIPVRTPIPWARWCAAIVLLLFTTVAARAQWQLVDTGAGINGVVYAKGSPNVAWSVGSAGYIRRSLDGGASWTSQPSNTSNALNGITSVDGAVLWTVGQGGVILKTINSGNTWFPQTSGVGSMLNAVSAVDGNVVWAVGNSGVIRKTVNGGTNWTGQTSGTAQPLNAVFAVDANTAWAVGGNGVILKTTDGTNWAPQSSGTTVVLRGITAVDASTAWAVGNTGTILKTTNGGTTWTPQTSTIIDNLFAVTATSSNVVWTVGDSGKMLKTINGGTNWQQLVSGTDKQLAAITAVDDQVSLSAGFFGTYRLTGDGGASFIGQVTGTSQPLHGITSANEQVFWTVGFSGAARTTQNGGNVWTQQTTPNTRNYYAVTKAGFNTLWAVGFAGTIIKSADGGAIWAEQGSGTSAQLNGVSAVDVNNVWAVGQTGVIIRTTNGLTWAPQTSGTSNHLNAVAALSTSLAWAVGNGGTILKWDGANWTSQTSGTATNLRGVTAVDANKAWAVGESGLVLVTLNGGATWTPQASSTTKPLNGISAWDGSNAWAVGDDGVIIHTTNGVNWFTETSPTVNDWFAVRAIASDKAFAAGNNGSVIRNFTPVFPPVAVTRPATNISGTTARLNATITPNGAPTVAEIEYGPGESGPFTNTATLVLTPNDGPVGQSVFAAVTGLTARSPYHFRAKATNVAGTVQGAILTFNTGNTVPVPTLVASSTNEDTSLPLTLTAADPDGDTITFAITETPAESAGVLSAITGGNQVTFVPAPNYHGTATFKYTAADAFGGLAEQTVTITVNSVNDDPTVTADNATVNGVVNVQMSNTGTWADVDGDNVTLSASIGSIVKNGNGTWSWTHTVSVQSTNVLVTITAEDAFGATDTATFTYNVATPPNIEVSIGGNPVADNAAGAAVSLGITSIGSSAITTVTVSNDGDGPLSISAITVTNGPVLSITDTVGEPVSFPLVIVNGASGSFGIRYAPINDSTTTGQVNIVSNALGSLSPYTFNVAGQGNRAPIVVNDSLVLSALVATEAPDLLTNDSDPDGGPLTIIGHTNGGSGTVSVAGNGNLVYTPGPTYIGYDVFTYTVQDISGGTATGSVTVTGAVPPPPVGPGNYAALLRDGGGQVQGMVIYKFNAAGGTSGQLRIGRVTRRFSGPSTGGTGNFLAIAKNNPTLPVTISLGTTPIGGYAALNFSVAGGALGTITGQSTKSPYSKGQPPLQAGRFTVLAVNEEVTPAVGATIYFRVAADGLVSYTGKNGAGYNISGGSILLTAGVTPIYAGRTGVGANVQSSELIVTVPKVYGNIHWDFTGPDVRVPSAFHQDYEVLGESYVPPASAAGLFGTPALQVTLNVPRFEVDNIPATVNPLVKNFTTVGAGAPDQLPITKLRFDLARGLFSGKVNVQGYAPRAFFGVILRQSGYGRGAVMDVSAIGAVRVEPNQPE